LAEQRVRRARSLVCFWDGRDVVLHNYLSNTRSAIAGELVPALGTLDEFTPQDVAVAQLGLNGDGGVELIDRLLEQDILVGEGSALAARDERLDRHRAWGQDARIRHFSRQQIRFEYDAEAEARRLRALVARSPPPAPHKELAERGLTLVQSLDDGGELFDVLRARRTRRRFSREPLSLADFSAVVQWTWGQTHDLESPVLGRYVLKTSPSGGARHSIEVYPLCLRVDGVPPGLYHYSVARHDLELVRAGEFQELAVDLCGAQGWVDDAAVVFFMTAIVERSMWKYGSSHAYRVLHLDAGHLGQTFHLVCTKLGLAPFTTTATKAAEIEEAIGLDGISEIALYTAVTGYPQEGATSPAWSE
jgi:SagB-type dehydrogenase family enzyme